MTRNRLGAETSPYLLQHKNNPVHWWAWGEAALAQARATGKPILLSVGYAACHWCHVMAHESFDNAATAAVMNELFVNIKVDREERPDVDAIYMAALHALGEQGGWPLTMFLTPEAKPFWGGTYFPPDERFGRPSFPRLLREIGRIHAHEAARTAKNAAAILEHLGSTRRPDPAARVSLVGIAEIASKLAGVVDREHGGIRGAPKFPQHGFFWLLWRVGMQFDDALCRDAVIRTLDRICQGGIYDHLGGGFSRYSVDERWLVPHFEKMLYDNALLVDLMTEVHRATGSPLLAARVRETIAFMLREMATAEGAFAASYDADSEGQEGKFYVWSEAEIAQVLGTEDAALFGRVFGVSAAGNFDGHTILNRLDNPELLSTVEEARLAACRAKLLAVRARRIPPGFDDKLLADWNGLAIAALAHAAFVFDEPAWRQAARTAYDAVLRLMQHDGRLVHCWRDGKGTAPATAADYANMIAAALALHGLGNERRCLDDALRLTDVLDRLYWHDQLGGYAFTAVDTPGLIVRTRTAQDDAVPNANATMVSCLAKLHLLTGEDRFRARAEAVATAFLADVAAAPAGHTGLMAAALDTIALRHIVVIGEAGGELTTALRQVSTPGALIQRFETAPDVPPGSPLAGKGMVGGRATAYACTGPVCSAPMTTAGALAEVLHQARS